MVVSKAIFIIRLYLVNKLLIVLAFLQIDRHVNKLFNDITYLGIDMESILSPQMEIYMLCILEILFYFEIADPCLQC